MRRGSSKLGRRIVTGQSALLIAALILSTTAFSLGDRAAAATNTLTVADTAYPIPAGALFVSPSGSDSNAGTQSAPYATLTKAVSVAKSGATIVMRGGTYRESINSIFVKVTIQAYPHEQVWLDGRQVVTGFSASGSVWARSGWNPGLCQNCFDPNAILPAAPAAGLPDMVFVDGNALAQVTTLGAVVPGTFYVDSTNHVLYLGSNPAGHVVEASVLSKALQFATAGATGSMVRGIGVIGYASNYNAGTNGAMVVSGSPNITFENDTFAWSASRALAVFSTGGVVRGSTFLYNGFQGMVANAASGLVIDSTRFAYSNWENFVYGWSSIAGSAGVKITSSKNVTVRDSVFDNNDATGLWFDLSCQGLTIVRNLAQDNLWDGIALELADTAVVASNVLTDNDGLGLKISGTTRTRVWNNTLANNATAQLGVYEDKRSNTNTTQRAAGITWDTSAIAVQNNIIASDDGRATLPLVHVFDGNSPKKVGAAQMITTMDNDVYARASTTTLADQDYWATLTAPNYATRYQTLAQFQSGTLKEVGGIERTNYNAASPFFVDETSGNYHLVNGSPARANGHALPSDIATSLGIATTPVDRGALSWPANPTAGATTTTTTTSTTSTTTAPTTTTTTTTTVPSSTTTTTVPSGTTTTTTPTSTTSTTTVGSPPPMPSVASLAPRSGPASGAIWVTIYGSNFNGTTAVRFGSVNASQVTIVSPTQLRALAPTSAPAVVHVTVASHLGWSAPSSADTFSFTAASAPAPRSGYWMLGGDGYSYAFGNAHWLGNAGNPSVAIASRPDGYGYWIVNGQGTVHGFGTAADHGGNPALRPWEQVSTISATPTGNGYWLFTNRGRAFAYGDAHFYGDMSGATLNGPVVASSATPTGHGYYMVGSDGGVFSFGDAHFHGSTGGMRLAKPVVGIAPTADNHGYWLVASDGGVFAFNAPFKGSMGGTTLNKPVNGVVAFGNGYLMVASDGGVFAFSNKHFSGSRSGASSAPVVGIASFST